MITKNVANNGSIKNIFKPDNLVKILLSIVVALSYFGCTKGTKVDHVEPQLVKNCLNDIENNLKNSERNSDIQINNINNNYIDQLLLKNTNSIVAQFNNLHVNNQVKIINYVIKKINDISIIDNNYDRLNNILKGISENYLNNISQRYKSNSSYIRSIFINIYRFMNSSMATSFDRSSRMMSISDPNIFVELMGKNIPGYNKINAYYPSVAFLTRDSKGKISIDIYTELNGSVIDPAGKNVGNDIDYVIGRDIYRYLEENNKELISNWFIYSNLTTTFSSDHFAIKELKAINGLLNYDTLETDTDHSISAQYKTIDNKYIDGQISSNEYRDRPQYNKIEVLQIINQLKGNKQYKDKRDVKDVIALLNYIKDDIFTTNSVGSRNLRISEAINIQRYIGNYIKSNPNNSMANYLYNEANRVISNTRNMDNLVEKIRKSFIDDGFETIKESKSNVYRFRKGNIITGYEEFAIIYDRDMLNFEVGIPAESSSLSTKGNYLINEQTLDYGDASDSTKIRVRKIRDYFRTKIENFIASEDLPIFAPPDNGCNPTYFYH